LVPEGEPIRAPELDSESGVSLLAVMDLGEFYVLVFFFFDLSC